MPDRSAEVSRSLWRVFRAPLGLAVVAFTGLIGALLTDGPADLLWSSAAALPLLVICWRLLRP